MTPDDILNDDYTYFDTLELTTAPCIIDCHAKIGCFELVYFKSLMVSQSHETRISMKLTGGVNFDQSTRN